MKTKTSRATAVNSLSTRLPFKTSRWPMTGSSLTVKLLYASALSAMVLACTPSSSGPTPKATVLSLESGLTAANRLADLYVKQPRCPAPKGTPICSDPNTVTQIGLKSLAAYNTLVTAQAAVDLDSVAKNPETLLSITNATNALTALQVLVSSLSPPK